jgi:hypothetical protein
MGFVKTEQGKGDMGVAEVNERTVRGHGVMQISVEEYE